MVKDIVNKVESKNSSKHCGYISIVGRPNVGKSTLLNCIITKKVSITSNKPQTTRYRILGIKTIGDSQFIYVDTPGMHQNAKNALNRYMNKVALHSLYDSDVVVFVVAGDRWKAGDEMVFKRVSALDCPVILAINKVDMMDNKELLLPYIEKISKKMDFADIVPLSAKNKFNIDKLELSIGKLLPENPFFFPDDKDTDRDQPFFAAEIIREKLTRFLGQELPYNLSVFIEQFSYQKDILSISATIFVDKKSQKSIVIGSHGNMLKKIGSLARKDLEYHLNCKVFLRLWVKVRSDWANDKVLLRNLGVYID